MRFKTFYLTESKRVLSEGGLAGHMTHPYDVLSPEDFLDFYDKLLSGHLAATEKVDGVNLFVGLNEKGKVVFARNNTESPSPKIEAKFPITHPGGDAFRAGFAALRKGIESLTDDEKEKYHLTFPGNFINLEIIYGEIPNLIQYSETDNFIVFHGYTGNKERGYVPLPEDNKDIGKLAKAIGSRKVTSEVVSYYGEVGSVKRDIKKATSNWIFSGPIEIPYAKMSKELHSVANKFKSYPETKKLKDWRNLSQDELFDTMKSITAKIGSEILINVKSELFSGVRKTPKGHPKIEGLVVNFKNHMIKVTGDFAQLNQDLWAPLKNGLDKSFKEFNAYILNDVLEISKISSIAKKSWEGAGRTSEGYLLKKNPKFYSDGKKLTEKINTGDVKKQIDKTMKKLERDYKKAENSKNIKKNDIIKAFRIGAYKLQEFKKALRMVKNRKDLTEQFAKIIFGL